MKISLFETEDLNIIQTIQPPDWPNLKTSFKYYLNHLNFCKPIKIILENKIVGIGTTIIHKDVAWLAQIVVHPDFRNRGIGSLITKTLIENLKNDSCKTILLIATEMGQPVYEKIGFEVVSEYSFLKNNNVDEGGQVSKNILKPDRKQFDEALKEKNFIQFRTAKRMSMGEKLNWHPEKIFNRVSGQIG